MHLPCPSAALCLVVPLILSNVGCGDGETDLTADADADTGSGSTGSQTETSTSSEGTGDGDGTTSGDGDGTTSGDGDGDGTTTAGDGDGTTTNGDGDGDGTSTSGDGDGDGAIDCSVLDEAACTAAPQCSGLMGTPLVHIDPTFPDLCTQPAEFAFCIDASTPCLPALMTACKGTEAWELWSQCGLPAGWSACDPGPITGPC